jgi:hypothetical protein
MDARERGFRTAGLIIAALAATAVGGTVAVVAAVHAQQSSAQTSESTGTSDESGTLDESGTSGQSGLSSSGGQAHARSGGS